MELYLCIGVPTALGMTNSAEQGVDRISLNSGEVGLSINPDNPWNPAMPSLKNRWSDSIGMDGRVPDSHNVGNVTETINLILYDEIRSNMARYLSALNLFIARARRYSSTFGEIEPVYLDFRALGAPGNQYALVYNIEMAVNWQHGLPFEHNTAYITLEIEREPAWRGLPPGAPPTLWTQYHLGRVPGKDYDYTDLSLLSGTALVQATVQNRHEWDAVSGYDAAPLSKNYIDIPAEDIPGDAPALLSVSVEYDFSAAEYPLELYIAHSSKPSILPSATGAQDVRRFCFLNGGDAETATTGTGLAKTTTADTGIGVISNGSSTQRYYLDFSGGRREQLI